MSLCVRAFPADFRPANERHHSSSSRAPSPSSSSSPSSLPLSSSSSLLSSFRRGISSSSSSFFSSFSSSPFSQPAIERCNPLHRLDCCNRVCFVPRNRPGGREGKNNPGVN